MEDWESEKIGIDETFAINGLVYEVLKTTISTSINQEMNFGPRALAKTILPKETMLKNILAYNLDSLEEQCYLTTGADGKIFLCGDWLARPVSYDGKMIPMMEYLKFNLTFADVEFVPYKSGEQFRKDNWKPRSELYTSYDLPKICKSNPFLDGLEIPEIAKMRGMQHDPNRPHSPMGERPSVVAPKKALEDLVQEISDDGIEEVLETLEELPEENNITEKQKQMIDQLVDSVLSGD